MSLRHRFGQRGVQSDLDEAFRLYSQFAEVSHGVSRDDLRIAKSWAVVAEELNHDSMLLAYHTALRFLDQHLAVLSPSSRHFDLVRQATSSFAMVAFSCSVRHGGLTTAVELV